MRSNTGARRRRIVNHRHACLLGVLCVPLWAADITQPLAEAIAQNNRAVQLSRERRGAEAEGLYRAALQAVSGDDLAGAKIASNLGELYRNEDRYADAERLFHQALEWRRKLLPETSLDLAYSMNNLGEIYRAEGRDWEARNLMETAAHNLQLFHPDAPGLPIVLSNFAIALCRFQEFEKAEELLRSALTVHQRLHNTATVQYAVTLTDLGEVLAARNQFQDSAPLYEAAIGIFEKTGTARTYLAAALADQGELYRHLDRLEDAREAELRALHLLDPDGDAVLRAQILRNLGNIVAGGTKPADSVAYFQQSLKIQEKTWGTGHPDTPGLLLDYASATQRAGNKSLARKLRKRAQELLARLRSQSLPQMTVSLRDLRDAR